jgi:hypothetical protein
MDSLIELLNAGRRFLWKAHGDGVQVFNWTGKNDYVVPSSGQKE